MSKDKVYPINMDKFKKNRTDINKAQNKYRDMIF